MVVPGPGTPTLGLRVPITSHSCVDWDALPRLLEGTGVCPFCVVGDEVLPLILTYYVQLRRWHLVKCFHVLSHKHRVEG